MKPRTFTLEEVRPQLGRFHLEATGDIEHVFRKISVDDEEWIKNAFPGKELKDFFPLQGGAPIECTAIELSRLYFHFIEDKTPFQPRKENVVDEDTLETEEVMLPAWRVFMKSISNLEMVKVVDAFLTTATGSRPVYDAKLVEGQKKSLTDPKEKSAGPKSSTKSKASTGGRRTR